MKASSLQSHTNTPQEQCIYSPRHNNHIHIYIFDIFIKTIQTLHDMFIVVGKADWQIQIT